MASIGDLFGAVEAGDAPHVRSLLAEDPSLAASRDEHGVSVLMRARYRFDKPLAEAILAHVPGLDVFEAASFGDLDRLATLIAHDPTLATAYSGDGFTPLHLAAFFGKPEAARLLLSRGADVDARGWMTGTALHSAAAGNHTEVIACCSRPAADPNARQSHGYTPLHSAAQNGNGEGVRLLLAHVADPSLANDDGVTAAALGAESGHAHVTGLLEA